MTHHTSDDAMRMMAALEEAGVSKPTRFLSLLHERGYHVARNPRDCSQVDAKVDGFFGKGPDGAG